jgi:excisionase family DNA binding protein
MTENNPLYTSTEAAAKLGITRMTVGRWVKSGRLVATKLGKRTFVAESEIRRLQPTDPCPVTVTEAVKRVISEYGEVLKQLGRE